MMIVAHGEVDVCDGLHSVFVTKNVGRLGCGLGRRKRPLAYNLRNIARSVQDG